MDCLIFFELEDSGRMKSKLGVIIHILNIDPCSNFGFNYLATEAPISAQKVAQKGSTCVKLGGQLKAH